MIFPAASRRTQKVDEEIDLLRRIEQSREEHLTTVSDSLVRRARELNKMVDEIKETRRGQNG